MSLVEDLEGLIAKGEELLPHGTDQSEGYNERLQPEYVAWRHQVIATIQELQELGSSALHLLNDLEQDRHGPYFFNSSTMRVLGALKGALALASRTSTKRADESEKEKVQGTLDSGKVFVVHGHDTRLFNQVARYLEKMGLSQITLSEQPGMGKTIIEKLEHYKNVHYAVVLLTPDDTGKAATQDGNARPRARQDLVLELGFFVGFLGRSHVGALYDESVELPSDYLGVEYIKIDAEGGWKLKLAHEMKTAGLLFYINPII